MFLRFVLIVLIVCFNVFSKFCCLFSRFVLIVWFSFFGFKIFFDCFGFKVCFHCLVLRDVCCFELFVFDNYCRICVCCFSFVFQMGLWQVYNSFHIPLFYFLKLNNLFYYWLLRNYGWLLVCLFVCLMKILADNNFSFIILIIVSSLLLRWIFLNKFKT